MQTTKNLIYRILELKTKINKPQDLHGKSKDSIMLITPLRKNVTFA